MRIIVDSNEKKWSHVELFIITHGLNYSMKRLNVGDYLAEGNERVAIDRKHGLDEVATNLCSKDDSRFWRELRRASETKTKLIFLVECSGIHSIADVARSGWKSRFSRVTGAMLADQMFRTVMAYDVEWLFCNKNECGEKIWNLLKGKK